MKNLKKAIDNLKNDLDSALLFVEIWDQKTGLTIESYNHNDKYTAIFSRIMNEIDKGLKDLGFPNFGAYQIIDLDMDSLLVFIKVKDKFFASCLLDKSKVQLGYLLGVSIPEFRKNMEETI